MAEAFLLFTAMAKLGLLWLSLYAFVSFMVWLVLSFQSQYRDGGRAVYIHIVSAFWLPVFLNYAMLWLLDKPLQAKCIDQEQANG